MNGNVFNERTEFSSQKEEQEIGINDILQKARDCVIFAENLDRKNGWFFVHMEDMIETICWFQTMEHNYSEENIAELRDSRIYLCYLRDIENQKTELIGDFKYPSEKEYMMELEDAKDYLAYLERLQENDNDDYMNSIADARKYVRNIESTEYIVRGSINDQESSNNQEQENYETCDLQTLRDHIKYLINENDVKKNWILLGLKARLNILERRINNENSSSY